MGGMTAAMEAYSGSSTPNVVMIETERRSDEILTGLDSLAEVCDGGTAWSSSAGKMTCCSIAS